MSSFHVKNLQIIMHRFCALTSFNNAIYTVSGAILLDISFTFDWHQFQETHFNLQPNNGTFGRRNSCIEIKIVYGTCRAQNLQVLY